MLRKPEFNLIIILWYVIRNAKWLVFIVSLSFCTVLSALSTLPDITFYGRVVDQNNAPVVNAKIYFSGTNAYLSAGGGSGYVYTDEEGYFEIDTEGDSLVIGGIGHLEIDGVYYESPSLLRGLDARFVDYDRNKKSHDNWRKYTKKENSYIIHAWRLTGYEGAIGGNVNGFYNADGKTYTLALDKVSNNLHQIDLVTDGLFHISCVRSHMESNRDYGDWSLTIMPINGGIQETDDLYANLAPESGYHPSLDIDMRKGSQDYIHKINKHYYFTSNNGNEYGSLSVEIEPFATRDKEACAIFIRYKINPTGSRNLELKRNNASKP